MSLDQLLTDESVDGRDDETHGADFPLESECIIEYVVESNNRRLDHMTNDEKLAKINELVYRSMDNHITDEEALEQIKQIVNDKPVA